PRTLLYHVLNQLMRRGLVSSKKTAWRTTYIAENPEHLYELLVQKEKESERAVRAVRELIPRLRREYQFAGARPSVRMFEGVEEYEKALEDIFLAGEKEILAYERFLGRKPGLETREAHERKRVFHKIRKRVLFFENDESLRLLAERPYNDFTSYRSVAKGAAAPFDAEVMLYSGKILYTSGYDGHEPVAIMVEDTALHSMQVNLFEALWKGGTDRTLYYTEAK
ncbi:MAG: hypothetical protein AAB923_03685, partial [Patescibacteria group bacterium]